MGQIVKILFCLHLFFALPYIALSQPLSPKSKEVKAAWKALNRQPDSKQSQLAYLKAFPSNKRDFVAVFDPDDFTQLYDESNKYIDSFIALAKDYPALVIDKSINIGRNLKWNADAINYLQDAIIELGINNTVMFSIKLNSLSLVEKMHLIKFLADVENYKAYPEYQRLINALTKIGEKALANKFEVARTEQEKERE